MLAVIAVMLNTLAECILTTWSTGLDAGNALIVTALRTFEIPTPGRRFLR